MLYVTLSELLTRLHDPQCSDTFLSLLRAQVKDRRVLAANLPGRCDVPQTHTRKTGETYTRTVRDMVIDGTPAFEAWFKDVNTALHPAHRPPPRPRRPNTVLSPETAEAGLVNFGWRVAKTRRTLTAEHEWSETQKRIRAAKRAAAKWTAPELMEHKAGT